MALDRVVRPDEDGARIDTLVASWVGESRGSVQQWVAAGLVTVDGAATAKSRRVVAGQRIAVADTPAQQAPPEEIPDIPVRWEDDDIAVVAKPSGLVVHAGAGTRRSTTLVQALHAVGLPLAAGDDPDRPGIVHRLDRGTSGLLVIAKSARARKGLAEIFKRHDVDRRYWTIVDGAPNERRATIDAPIARSGRNRTKFTVAADGRHAVTHYDVVEAFGRATVLDVRLETGRTHQVRVHLSAVGHPVAGDRVYGASPAVSHELGLQRPALHAAHLGFDHPLTGERVAVDEPLPDDLAEAHRRLRTLA